jgi:hypothetical protein
MLALRFLLALAALRPWPGYALAPKMTTMNPRLSERTDNKAGSG